MPEAVQDAIPEQVRGLSAAQVADRVERGDTNAVQDHTSRSLASILRANIFTRFNAIIATMLVLVLIFGKLPDALFGFVMIFNIIIGVVQELRAKRTLDRLTLLSAPRTMVLRDGDVKDVVDADLVLDDVIRLSLGDQIGVDCDVLSATSLQVDESLLTGEADPVEKAPGDELLSGSFVVAGSGWARATRVGENAYARKIAAEAKQFSLAESELRDGINKILRVITWVLIPVGALLFVSQLRTGDSFAEGIAGAVAGVVAMVPEGLVLLTSLALAVAVIRLARRDVVVQEMPAVETLARVDVICLDKTGTLTEGNIVFETTRPLPDGSDDGSAKISESSGAGQATTDALSALVAADTNPNPSLRAIAAAYPDSPGWTTESTVAFSSARKFSAVTFADRGTWILGAPEIVFTDSDRQVAGNAGADLAKQGKRVLALAHSNAAPSGDDLPADREARALVVLAEKVRPDAGETIGYFRDQHVAPKVISGDNPRTVAAIATQAEIPDAGSTLDARELPQTADSRDDAERISDAVETHTVFGRVSPEQKRAMVGALQGHGHTVAMTGDGVNDVLALKDADIGIAMGAGTDATKSVAQLVLLKNDFAVLPFVVAEGRRIIANIERVAALFLTKSVYATLLAIVVGILEVPFPFLPRHLSLVGSLTIGIPAFVLSFAPSDQPARSGFIKRVVRIALPAGFICAAASFAAYAATGFFFGSDLEQARTAATITLFCVTLWVLIDVARPLRPWKVGLVASMVVLFVLAFVIPFGRKFFLLEIPQLSTDGVIAAVIVVAIVLLEASYRVVQRFDRG